MPYHPIQPIHGHQPDGGDFGGEEQRQLVELEAHERDARMALAESRQARKAETPSWLKRIRAMLRR